MVTTLGLTHIAVLGEGYDAIGALLSRSVRHARHFGGGGLD